MFCNEPVIAVYAVDDDAENSNAFFDFFHDLAYHVSGNCRMILETEHYFISLEAAGVKKASKTCSINEYKRAKEWLEPFVHTDFLKSGESPWIEYESTLFVGERLLDVTRQSDYFLLCFDDFNLKIVPHDPKNDDVPLLHKKDHWAYNHAFGCERLIKRKCDCGGTGELFLDFVSDFVVCCDKCKQATSATNMAIDAINDWNAGRIQCDLRGMVIE